MLRMDAILRCLMIPGFKALIIRRTMPELRRSHLGDIPIEMKKLGGEAKGFVWLSTVSMAKFPNGSSITFAHCETEADILNFLSSQYGFIGFDELSTFTLNQFLQISVAARAPLESGYTAVVRAGSNPLGLGADWMYAWFVDKTVDRIEFQDYNPDDFEMQFATLADNPSLDQKANAARLKNLPEHMRKAWLLGERVFEGMYFGDFHKMFDLGDQTVPWHVIEDMPVWRGKPIALQEWISVYRAIDWGYFPDPAVCLWIVVLPNKRSIVFKEMKWNRTLAEDVAKEIKKASEGMHVVESFCDPTMFLQDGTSPYTIADKFESNGVPLTPAINSRELYGYSIHEYLNTLIEERPRLQIIRTAAHNLIRTIPQMRMDKTDPRKMADGDDHYVVALAYFCMGVAMPTKDPQAKNDKRWMQPKRKLTRGTYA